MEKTQQLPLTETIPVDEESFNLNETKWWVNSMILPEFEKQLDFALKK